MSFPKVTEAECATTVPGGDDESLVLKPESLTGCAGEVQFKTFLKTGSGGETEVTNGLTYTSLSPSTVSINAATGVATLVAAGITTITVTNGTLSAMAQVEVVGEGETCCDDIVVATVLMLDNSKSMKNTMPYYPGTRLGWVKFVARLFATEMRLDKDLVGLLKFNVSATEVQAISHTEPTPAVFNSIPQTSLNTDLEAMLISAIARLDVETCDRRVIAIFSDGENRTGINSVNEWQDLVDTAQVFKDSGGIIIGVGAAAGGDGFALLQAIASGGFFLNASDQTTTNAMVENLTGLLCYYCGGMPPSYNLCLDEPLPAQVPVVPPLTQLEL